MRRRAALTAVVLAVVALTVGLYLFEPWRLFTDSTVNEAAPSSSPSAPDSEGASPTGSTAPPPAPRDEILAKATFEDAEHETSGSVVVLKLADGRRFVRFEDLATSDGPDLHVWITDQPSGGDWGSYDDGRYVRLGGLKANNGNQNYEIPADADIAGLTSVVIWCDRFNVAFGTAPVAL